MAPHYLRLVRRQLEDWAAEQRLDTRQEGLVVTVSLDSRLQQQAEAAVQAQTALLQSVADAEWSQARLRAGPPQRGERVMPFAHFWRSHPELAEEVARGLPSHAQALKAGHTAAQALAIARADPLYPQRLAERSRLEAGFVAVAPDSGAVRAYVGSRSFALDRFDHVTQARRQPGSTFKPFVYGTALMQGYTPESTFIDEPRVYTQANGATWQPTDGGASFEPMTLRTALARSRNTVTAQVIDRVGPSAVARLAQAMGVDRSYLHEVPSLALGTSPVTLLDMANSYATLAALGQRRHPVLIEKIEDTRGNVLYVAQNTAERVMPEADATLLVDMLRDAVTQGTATGLRRTFAVKGDVAGKTGTSQRNADGWFMALHPQLVAGAWVGFNDQRVTMRSTEWAQGGRSALRLVGAFLASAQQQRLLALDARFPAVARPTPAPAMPTEPTPVLPLEAQADTDPLPAPAGAPQRDITTAAWQP